MNYTAQVHKCFHDYRKFYWTVLDIRWTILSEKAQRTSHWTYKLHVCSYCTPNTYYTAPACLENSMTCMKLQNDIRGRAPHTFSLPGRAFLHILRELQRGPRITSCIASSWDQEQHREAKNKTKGASTLLQTHPKLSPSLREPKGIQGPLPVCSDASWDFMRSPIHSLENIN